MAEELNRDTLAAIDKMVERVARKAGYTGRENMTYKELLQAKLEQKRDKIKSKINKYRHKFSLKPGNTEFAEEIRTYLADGLADLMREGHSEQEALAITARKFDEAELNDSFEGFAKAFGGFGMEEWVTDWYEKNGEAIGLFYAGFTILGFTIGALCGYLLGHSWQNTLIGLGAGFFAGVGLGLLSNALIVLRRNK